MSAKGSVRTAADAGVCFHCGAVIGPNAARLVVIDGAEQLTCSARCADVAATIDAAGFASFYRQRRGDRHLPVEFETGLADHLDVYDDPGLQQRFAETNADGVRNATLLIEGITCAACVRLVESRLAGLDAGRNSRGMNARCA